ncbi:MAG: pyridoxine 5'-phosphate synthase [Methyloligella sp.]|nr:MAG: pyridoxine 5'-phosphate synthase [Methyloligella sp.]
MAPHLSVNLNAIALLRNRRDLSWPSVTGIGALALDAGAHGLTVHPRPDERHIRRQDVYDLKEMITERYPLKEFNIEGYPDDRFMALILDIRPDQVTFVPDDPSQNTSDHGWDVASNKELLTNVINIAHEAQCRVSLFVDTDPKVVTEAASVGADRVEIYTGPYGALVKENHIQEELDRIEATFAAAKAAGIEVNAGHDLTLANLPALVKRVPGIAETSIGHCFTADCLVFGVKETVKRYLTQLGHQI